VFRTPTLRLAGEMADNGSNVFAYQFNWAPPQSPFKACHCIDLPFTFGNLDAWPDAAMLAGGDPAVMGGLSAAIRRAWIAFIRTGRPEHDEIPAWPRLTHGWTMQFDTLLERVRFDP
jgi:para-nitrobenzyl esterase